MQQTATKSKLLLVRVTAQQHKSLKLASCQNDTTMSELVITALKPYLNDK
jgi:predicted HicB family RNase H-like nuclease